MAGIMKMDKKPVKGFDAHLQLFKKWMNLWELFLLNSKREPVAQGSA